MADMITRCPKCGTAFRISDALLKSAKGVVRCGSCLSVFNARDHLEAGKSAPSSAAQRPQQHPQQQHPQQELRSHTGQPAPTAPSASAINQTQPTPVPPAPSPVAPTPVAKREEIREDDELDVPEWRRRKTDLPSAEAAPPAREQSVEEEEDDEAWALELLKDDDDLNVQFKKITSKPASPTPPAAPEIADIPSPPSEPAAEAVTGTAEIPEEEPEEAEYAPAVPDYALVETFEPAISGSADEDGLATQYDALDEPAFDTAPEEQPQEDGEPEDNELGEEDEEPEEQEEIEALQPPPEPLKRKPIRPKLEPKPLKEVIASLEPEPLEVDWQEPGAWRRRLLWPALALVALLCLLGQVAWLEYERLSRVEPYRSAYAIACRFIGCQLPDLLDRRQIQTSNLLVRSHPDIADALQVDVILQNNAPFEQTFPVLELTFTNLRSEPIASRKLTPAEYLGGELTGRDKMPVRQPIHIALEIADPGKEAVSYHITIID